MAEGTADEQRSGGVDTELIQREQPPTPNGSRGRSTSSPQSAVEAANLSLAATAAPVNKKPGYFSENGYLLKLPKQERQRVRQEIKRRFKPGENWLKC